MKGIFWNCRGAGKSGMTSCLYHLINDHSLDFLGIQETMKKKFLPKYFRRVDPFDRFHWEWIPARGRSGGILCGVNKDNLSVVKTVEGKYVLYLEVADSKNHFNWAI